MKVLWLVKVFWDGIRRNPGQVEELEQDPADVGYREGIHFRYLAKPEKKPVEKPPAPKKPAPKKKTPSKA